MWNYERNTSQCELNVTIHFWHNQPMHQSEFNVSENVRHHKLAQKSIDYVCVV